MSQSPSPVVLIVEDEPLVRMLAVEAFLDANFVVLEAASASEALLVIDGSDTVNLLFTDVNMPGDMNGIALSEYLFGLRPDLKIIVTSALPLLREVDHVGACFLPKPYDMDGLCDMAERLSPAPVQ